MAPGVALSDLDWLAFALAVLVNLVLGFLWYNPKLPTGAAWAKATGMAPDHKPTAKQMAKALVLAVLGAVFIMVVLAHTFVAYRDAYRLDQPGYDLTLGDGLTGALFVWLGFFVPVLWAQQAWENRPWSLFFVHAGYYLAVLLVAGALLVTV